MQRYHFIIVFIVLTSCIISCSRSTTEQVKPLNGSTLPGTWELRGISGGMIVPNPDNYKPGNGNIWKFTASHFERIIHDSVCNSGSYAITHAGVDLNTNRTIDQFIFNTTPANHLK